MNEYYAPGTILTTDEGSSNNKSGEEINLKVYRRNCLKEK